MRYGHCGEFDQITSESGIAINDSLISRALDASEIAQLVNLYSQGCCPSALSWMNCNVAAS